MLLHAWSPEEWPNKEPARATPSMGAEVKQQRTLAGGYPALRWFLDLKSYFLRKESGKPELPIPKLGMVAHIPTIPVSEGLVQTRFKISLDYLVSSRLASETMRPCLKGKTKELSILFFPMKNKV